MGKEILRFEDIKVIKVNFFTIRPLYLKRLDIKKVLLTNKVSFSEENYQYFIGYLHNDHKFKPLHIILPKTSAYVKKL